MEKSCYWSNRIGGQEEIWKDREEMVERGDNRRQNRREYRIWRQRREERGERGWDRREVMKVDGIAYYRGDKERKVKWNVKKCEVKIKEKTEDPNLSSFSQRMGERGDRRGERRRESMEREGERREEERGERR